MTFVHDATFKNSARSAEIPRDSIDHGATGLSPPQTKIILFAQTWRNPGVRRSPPFINSPKKGVSSASSEFSQELSLLDARRSAREQSTDRKTEAGNRDEIRAGPLIRREKPRRSAGRFVSTEFAAQRPISGTTGAGIAGGEGHPSCRRHGHYHIFQAAATSPRDGSLSRSLSSDTSCTNDDDDVA